MIKELIAYLSLAVVCGLLLTACNRGDKSASPPPPPEVGVSAIVQREITEWDEYTGRLEAVRTVEVRPRVGGFIERVNFKEGAIVKKGELLFVIDARPYQAELPIGPSPNISAPSIVPTLQRRKPIARRSFSAHGLSHRRNSSSAQRRGRKASLRSAQQAQRSRSPNSISSGPRSLRL